MYVGAKCNPCKLVTDFHAICNGYVDYRASVKYLEYDNWVLLC